MALIIRWTFLSFSEDVFALRPKRAENLVPRAVHARSVSRNKISQPHSELSSILATMLVEKVAPIAMLARWTMPARRSRITSTRSRRRFYYVESLPTEDPRVLKMAMRGDNGKFRFDIWYALLLSLSNVPE